jgi:hypothetical protein
LSFVDSLSFVNPLSFVDSPAYVASWNLDTSVLGYCCRFSCCSWFRSTGRSGAHGAGVGVGSNASDGGTRENI